MPAAAPAPCVACGATRWTPRFSKGGFDFAECGGCGLVSLVPIPTERELAAHYETSYREGCYATFAADEAARDAVAEDRLARIRPHAPDGPWLDVGASTGAFVACVTRAGLQAEGVEVSASAAARARERGAHVHVTSVEAFTPSAPLAVVTALDVIEHLPAPPAFLARVRTWLRSDGLLALTLPNAASWTARLMGRHWFYYAGPYHVHYFTPTTIVALLQAAGFRDVTVRDIPKPLPLGYAGVQLRELVAPLAPVANLISALARTPLGRRPLPLPLGEMLVTARV